ncbi:MAG TPA: adenylate/guanylate cyclase domain-containing protein [Spirochaetia bacterium]|nr:adenylate/guanylate cyclase domain-containing protein [Spirochaetia bacterium]
MRIASRISALFLPLLIAPLAFVGFSSWFAAQDGITAIARDLLTFKTRELVRFASSQYSLLDANDLAGDAAFRSVAIEAIADYASQLVGSDSELMFAIDEGGDLAFATSAVSVGGTARLADDPPAPGWTRLDLDQIPRVGVVAAFEPLGWLILVTEAEGSFFSPVDRITRQTLLAAGISIVAMLIVIGFVSKLITSPLNETVRAMRGVIADGDLNRTVEAPLNDETGELADSFNYMIRSLDAAYSDMKAFALNAAYSERRESKIRTVFQRYVPQHVLEQFFDAPESMLMGEERALAVLFSDIRGFTSFSEGLSSHEVVESLNKYFSLMVEVVDQNSGIVDKYIGDAIMAFFGAPVPTEQSPHDAVMTAFHMLSALDDFNEWQVARGREAFRIGIAINYGPVTIGNIGSDRKMDYTVIGDMVNVVSRLEGLTKVYRQEILISESIRRYIRGVFPVRMVDRVQVKGRDRGLAVWTVKPSVSKDEERGWKEYHAALLHYYNREFEAAIGGFARALE